MNKLCILAGIGELGFVVNLHMLGQLYKGY